MKSFFEPPLWFERRTLILKILNKHKDIKKVIDYGCNVGNLLEVLKNNDNYEEIIAVDIDENVLKEAYEKSKVTKYYMDYMKTKPLNIKLFKGNIKYPDKRLLNSDALICSEVIEHLDNETLKIFPEIVFNIYKPKLVIITTPNCEFNYYFKELNYGTPNQKFRHEEHFFEWTREEFYSWSKNISEKYNYDFEITGIGSAPEEIIDGDRGFCTQIAVFQKQNENDTIVKDDNNTTEELTENFECLYDIDYPYFDNSNVSVDEVLKELVCFSKNYIERIYSNQIEINNKIQKENIKENKDSDILINNIDKNINDNNDNNDNNDEDNNKIDNNNEKDSNNNNNNIEELPYVIDLESMWQDYYIYRLCGNKNKLKEFLKDEKVKSIFYYNDEDNHSTNEDINNTSEKVYVQDINELYNCFEKYFPRQYSDNDYDNDSLYYDSDNTYQSNKYNEYSDKESDSFWDHYSDSFHDNYSDAEHNI